MKRLFDVLVSFTGIVVLLPLFVLIGCAIVFTSRGGALFRQVRIGQGGRPFVLYKFRSMVKGAEMSGTLTTSRKDERITKPGRFLRASKLDELPQLFNVLKGDMSIVGPRPEVPEFVELYTEEQRRVLTLRPGITDYASIKYANENALLSEFDDPVKGYIEQVMPDKLKLNLSYLEEQSMMTDIKIIARTALRIILGR